MPSTSDQRSVAFVTLGCAKNEVDTRHMSETLAAHGIRIVDDVRDCDCVIVNTCAFIESAAQESIDEILELAGDEELAANGVGIVVAGCLPSRFGADLEEALTEARVYVPCDKEPSIAEAVERCLADAAHDADGLGFASGCDQAPCDASNDPASSAQPYAYVKISDGCSRFCSYCTIPFIRGPYRSIPYDEIADECKSVIGAGAKEVVLIGQDTGLWGTDLGDGQNLATLLARLAEEFPHTWLRVMYTQPEHVTCEMLDVISSHDNVCPYLDIPMQHCCERILKGMNRTGSRESLAGLAKTAREKVPGIAIRTTLMCGFPGETEDEYDELVEFVEEMRFDYVGVFAFSPEDGTKAATLPDQVPDDEREYRAERLRTIADAISSSIISERVGQDLPYLCEGIEDDGQCFGRCMTQAPEVDGLTYCDGIEPGSRSIVRIIDTFMYDMEADPVGR